MQSQPLDSPRRAHSVVGCEANGQTRTFRLSPASAAQQAAYRRLAVAVLGLDVSHLAHQLRAGRTAALPNAA